MESEKSLAYNGVLSTFAEWHSFAIGFLAGYLPPEERSKVIDDVLSKDEEYVANSSHFEDSVEEPAYVVLGLVVCLFVRWVKES